MPLEGITWEQEETHSSSWACCEWQGLAPKTGTRWQWGGHILNSLPLEHPLFAGDPEKQATAPLPQPPHVAILMLSKHPPRPLLPHGQLGLPCSGDLFPHKTPLAQFPSLKSCPWTLSHTLNPALCNYSSSSCWKCDNTEKLRNLWHGTSEQPSSKEMVFLIFMLRLVTFSVILSQSKEKCSQGLSISNKHLLWLSSALLFALVFNYRTHIEHLLFASAATVNNIYYTDYHTTQCFPVYTLQRHIL